MKFVYLFLSIFTLFQTNAQNGEWTWIKGTDTVGSFGSFGTKGIPALTNEPPGLFAPAFWPDTAGKLWIWGGWLSHDDGVNNGLWNFDLNSMNWTWVNGDSLPLGSFGKFAAPAGIFDSMNNPGFGSGYAFATWTDKQNHLWMYGGSGGMDFSINLWQYDPAINQWAWMNGGQNAIPDSSQLPVYGTKGIGASANTPGGRQSCNTAWTDTLGNLWLFGGYAAALDTSATLDVVPRNDMWKYDMATGFWIWMSGSNVPNDAGVYGQQGAPSVNCYPSARFCEFHWQDSEGNFWLAGGTGAGAIDSGIYYDDVWKFNPFTLEWTWVKGSSYPDTTNISAGNCKTNAANQQGGRKLNSAAWKICDKMVINYGGFNGYGEYNLNLLNDIWAFTPTQNEWIEINEYPNTGSYGVQGVTSLQNYPPARYGSACFIDKSNNLYMFGGENENGMTYNDLWKYTLDTTCLGSLYCNETATGITTIRNNNETISIYPNPTTGNWQLIVDNDLIGAQEELLDDNGRVLYQTPIKNLHTQIPAPSSGGVYLLRITSGTNTITKKLIKL